MPDVATRSHRPSTWAARIAAAVVLVAGAGGDRSLADAGRIPIFEPATLAQSGSYVLTRNVGPPASGPTLIVDGASGALDVSIDLNGFMMSGLSGQPVIEATDVLSLAVRNGSFRPAGNGHAVRATDSGRVVIEDLRVSYTAAGTGSSAFTANGVEAVSIRNNEISSSPTGGTGISISGLGVPTQGVVEGNNIRGHSSGIGIGSVGRIAVRGNRIHGLGGGFWGIRVNLTDGVVIEGNQVYDISTCIQVANASGLRVIDNLAYASASGAGFSFANAVAGLISGNVAQGCAADGMELANADRCHFVGNLTEGNGGAGIFVNSSSSGNTFSGNVSRGNGAPTGTCLLSLDETSCVSPLGGGNASPDICVDAPGNVSFCNNMMPGPPKS